MPIFISYDNPMLMGDVQADNIGAATIDAGFRNAQNTFGNLDQQYQASQRQQIAQQGQFVQQDRQQAFLGEQDIQRQAAQQLRDWGRQADAIDLENFRQENRMALQQSRGTSPATARGGAGRAGQSELDIDIARAEKLYGIAKTLREQGQDAMAGQYEGEADKLVFRRLRPPTDRTPAIPPLVAAPPADPGVQQPVQQPMGMPAPTLTPPTTRPAAPPPAVAPNQPGSGGGLAGMVGSLPKQAIRFSQAVRGTPTQAAMATAISSIAQANGGRVGIRLANGQVIDARIMAINPDNTATVVNNQGQQVVPLSQITAPQQSPPRMPGPGEALVETEDGRRVIINKATMQEVP